MSRPYHRAGNSKVATYDPPRHRAPLPAERVVEQPFVLNTYTGRLVAPWPRHAPLWPDEQQQLLAVMARIEQLAVRGVFWLWPDPTRDPVPVTADDAVQWCGRWEADRAVYVRR